MSRVVSRVGTIITGCDVGITAASKSRPMVGIGVLYKKEFTDKRAWTFLDPQQALEVADALREYALEGMKYARQEGGDSSMGDTVELTRPHDPEAAAKAAAEDDARQQAAQAEQVAQQQEKQDDPPKGDPDPPTPPAPTTTPPATE